MKRVIKRVSKVLLYCVILIAVSLLATWICNLGYAFNPILCWVLVVSLILYIGYDTTKENSSKE